MKEINAIFNIYIIVYEYIYLQYHHWVSVFIIIKSWRRESRVLDPRENTHHLKQEIGARERRGTIHVVRRGHL